MFQTTFVEKIKTHFIQIKTPNQMQQSVVQFIA
jgi:hypothetical protein